MATQKPDGKKRSSDSTEKLKEIEKKMKAVDEIIQKLKKRIRFRN
jgi:hypothetical protein